VSEYDREASIMRHWKTRGCGAMGGGVDKAGDVILERFKICFYIYPLSQAVHIQENSLNVTFCQRMYVCYYGYLIQ